MSGVEDILAYAWNKDAVSLAPALDADLSARAAAVIQNMTASVAAQMFGQDVPVYNEEPQEEYSTDDNTDQTFEDQSDEDI